MNGLFLHTGNRLESLVGQLAGVVSKPGPTPLQPETVLVQSLGMQRWISLQLAEKLGICMNVEFPFPRGFIDETIRALIPDAAPPESFAPELLAWKIHRLLPGFLDLPGFAPVARFLADADDLKLFQLSQRLGRLFDQYLAYRPEMLCEWEAAAADPELLAHEQGDAAWQAPLWRALNSLNSPNDERRLHFATLLRRLPEAIARSAHGTDATDGPNAPRLSIFGITSLPPAQMEVLFHLAANRPVHLFLLAPSREYHGDDLTPKQRARMQLPDAPEGEGGNPLLTSLGRLHAHFTEVILELDERVGHRTIDPEEQFTDPSGHSLLHRLQSDILHARPPERLPLEPGDDSVQLHSCHSPMREIEVLYDSLLSFLDATTTAPGSPGDEAEAPLLPRDILVMAPDIEKYAPFIHAVFGNPEAPALRIPYSIADRQARSESHAVDTFLRLLELPDGRFTAPEVATLLNSPPLRATFGFTDAEMEQLHDWLLQSGIRWGIDADHRGAMALPAFGENSWRSGLDRLLLGYAVMGHNTDSFSGILPLDDVESGSPDLLGRFLTASEHLFLTVAELKKPRPLGEWPPILHAIIDRFFAGGEAQALQADEIDAIAHLRQTIVALEEIAAAAGPEQPAPFPAIREHLVAALSQATARGRFLTGGVTFCALKPMRSIPARVIWLLGMDDGVFPRRGEPLQFDLMSKKRRLGDRSPREDDRALFLEAIISAREKLCISTIGRSIRNNEPIPPSIVISEFLDYLDTAVEFPPGTTSRDQLLVEHRLHPFSPVYFKNHTQYTSYSAANAAVANANRRPLPPERNTPGTFPFSTPLPPPEESYLNVTLDQLVDFLAAPCGAFLKARYGILLRERDESLAESEPLSLNRLQSYSIRRQLSDAILSGTTIPGPASFVARCELPPGALGEQHYHQLAHAANRFSALVRDAREACGPLAPPSSFSLDFALPFGTMTFSGVLNMIHGTTCLLHRSASFTPKDRLKAWVHHLAWNATCEAAARTGCETLFISETEQCRYLAPPEANATALLGDLLTLYWEGLLRPLPLFPGASYAYARHLHEKPDEEEKALNAAIKSWTSTMHFHGEDQLAGAPLCFPPECGLPFDEEFTTLALRLFSPLLSMEKAEPLS